MYRFFNILVFLILSFCSIQNVKAYSISQKQDPPQTSKAIKRLFFNIPNPTHVSKILKSIKLPYDSELMNPSKNEENYLSQSNIALNIGVYGSDLSYIRMYEQYQDAIVYLLVIKRLTIKLGVPQENKQETFMRVEKNMQNQDSLLNIISNTFTNIDTYLNENKRNKTSALIILGGWIETLYLSVNSLTPQNQELRELVAEQKYSLKNLLKLLEYTADNPKIQEFLPDLRRLYAIFQKIKYVKAAPKKIKLKNGNTIIQNRMKLLIPDGTFSEIKRINDDMRNKICNS